MDILVAKLLGLLGLFGLMLAGVLVPVRLLLVDYDRAHRYRRALSLCNSFGGGVFLATCFNALLPAVRDKVTHTHTHTPVNQSRVRKEQCKCGVKSTFIY